MSRYTKETLGSANSRGVLPSAMETLVETSPTATEAMLKNNEINSSFFIMRPFMKKCCYGDGDERRNFTIAEIIV